MLSMLRNHNMPDGWRRVAWPPRANRWPTAVTTQKSNPSKPSCQCNIQPVNLSSILLLWTSTLRIMWLRGFLKRWSQRYNFFFKFIMFENVIDMPFLFVFVAPPQNPWSPRQCQGFESDRSQNELHQGLAILAWLWNISIRGQIPWRKERRTFGHSI